MHRRLILVLAFVAAAIGLAAPAANADVTACVYAGVFVNGTAVAEQPYTCQTVDTP